ncbi:MAG: hypothetical protein QW343_02350 [Candidatus Norongarragalinales archaeon]
MMRMDERAWNASLLEAEFLEIKRKLIEFYSIRPLFSRTITGVKQRKNAPHAGDVAWFYAEHLPNQSEKLKQLCKNAEKQLKELSAGRVFQNERKLLKRVAVVLANARMLQAAVEETLRLEKEVGEGSITGKAGEIKALEGEYERARRERIKNPERADACHAAFEKLLTACKQALSERRRLPLVEVKLSPGSAIKRRNLRGKSVLLVPHSPEVERVRNLLEPPWIKAVKRAARRR